MHLLVEPAAVPGNSLAEMDPSTRAEVMAQGTIQSRVNDTFPTCPLHTIPRGEATIARTTGDPMQRVRRNAGAENPLRGMRILSARYGKGIIEALGHDPLDTDHFMSVPESDIDALPETVRRRLGLE